MTNYIPTPAELEARGFTRKTADDEMFWQTTGRDGRAWRMVDMEDVRGEEHVYIGPTGGGPMATAYCRKYRLRDLADLDLLLWMLGLSEERPA